MDKELIKIFEIVKKRFLNENANFILSNVAERSLCSTFGQYISD